ncbi:MAG: thymidine phosphorylase, partial [Chloroflexi bacterium]|nr:thymidine phosphorylase [Chloroflexota bacterium]
MRVIDLIAKKRDRRVLTAEEIEFFIRGATHGEIPDYQITAWLMAVYLNGMSKQETVDLTLAMAHSGEVMDLRDMAPFVVDKHSTGGVGDKTTLVVAPMVAATGVPVGKMSGRGLGFTGGTLDKLESFPGFRVDLSVAQFKENLRRYGIVVAGQSADLAPADGILYSLRDATATVECLPLIASSIMSKKLAAGAEGIVLDVKAGSGAFMKTLPQARKLAQAMIEIGEAAGKKMAAVLADMEQPLGMAVGNALEVKEAIDTLRGQGPADFLEHSLAVAGQMLILAEKAGNDKHARQILLAALRSGEALDKLRDLVGVQGSDPKFVDHPELLPQAPLQIPLPSPQ